MSPPPRLLIELLAREHDEHLRWLRRRTQGRLAADEAEDVLQAAYAKALRTLEAPASRAVPRFDDIGRARAWLRTLAANLAVDDDRHRHGRGEVRRPQAVVPDTMATDATPAVDAGVDVEGDALRAVESERQRAVIDRALAALAPEHRQILHLRYARNLDPAAIMLLENLTRRQWDGRHSRALKALARALSRLHVSAECRQTRRLLRRSPAVLLQRDHGVRAAGAHLEACVACDAFARSAQAAVAALPLPIAIDAVRLQILEYFSGGPSMPPRPQPDARPLTASAGARKLAAVMAAGAAAMGAPIASDGAWRALDREREISSPAGTARERRSGPRWADHAVGRAALERSARFLTSRASGAAREGTGSGLTRRSARRPLERSAGALLRRPSR